MGKSGWIEVKGGRSHLERDRQSWSPRIRTLGTYEIPVRARHDYTALLTREDGMVNLCNLSYRSC